MLVFSISSLHRLTNWLAITSVPHTVICRLIQFLYKKVFQSSLNKDETPVQCQFQENLLAWLNTNTIAVCRQALANLPLNCAHFFSNLGVSHWLTAVITSFRTMALLERVGLQGHQNQVNYSLQNVPSKWSAKHWVTSSAKRHSHVLISFLIKSDFYSTSQRLMSVCVLFISLYVWELNCIN